jgi:hypothetical protein
MTLTDRQMNLAKQLLPRLLGHPRVLEILADCADDADAEQDSFREMNDSDDDLWLVFANDMRMASQAILAEDPDLWERDYPVSASKEPMVDDSAIDAKLADEHAVKVDSYPRQPSLSDLFSQCARTELIQQVIISLPGGPSGALKEWGLEHFTEKLLSRIAFPVPRTVWMVGNRTSTMIFASKTAADSFLAGQPASSWFSSLEVPVLGAPQAALLPMSAAPKDGRAILAYLEGSDIPHAIRWVSKNPEGEDLKEPRWQMTWDGYVLSPADGPRGWIHALSL